MKHVVVCLLVIFNFYLLHAQSTRYIIRFRDKGHNTFSLNNPIAFLSQRAIDRRTRYNIGIDSLDLPITQRYIDSVITAGAVILLNASKWLNSITIKTTDAAALNKIKSFPFVINADPIAARFIENGRNKNEKTGNAPPENERIYGAENYYNYGQSLAQIHIHNGDFLHDIGLRGQSMIIGMLDAGYFNYTSLKAFDSVNANGQVLGIYDFVAHDNSVTEDHQHGMECFSIMAANIPGQFVGSSPKASYYLFRTEDASSEYPIEEHNWVCGAEKVDSAGGDVISSSLGYTTFDNPAFNHTYADMNGRTTMAAIGATIAARKGILIFNAAGNEGANSWHYISTPADADSIVTVGAVNTSGQPAVFSSFGPTSDGRIKPDVVSVGEGTIIETPGNTVGSGSGTSFACPNMAGLATCLWQGFNEMNNIKILRALQQSSTIALAPNNQIGYGIPDMKKATLILLKQFAASSAVVNNCTATISWNSKDIKTMVYEVERQIPGQPGFTKFATINAKGNTFSNQSYQLIDIFNNVPAGTINYRIREIIDTATATFSADYITSTSAVITNSCNAGPVNSVIVAPNPVTDVLNVYVNQATPLNDLKIVITDVIGRRMYSSTTHLTTGSGTLIIPVNNFAKGKYFIRLYNSSTVVGGSSFLKL